MKILLLACLLGSMPFPAVSRAQETAGENPGPPARAVPWNITLTFREKGSGKLISKAEVRAGDEVLFSDPEGRLALIIPARPAYDSVEVYREGYVSETISVSGLREVSAMDIFLYPDIPANQVVIRGKKKRSVSKKQVSAAEIREVTPRGDPAQITKLLPGVQSQAFRPEVVIRGSGPNDSTYYVDGLKIPFIFHSIGGISVLPKSLIDQVGFQAGGFQPSYGGATGGVVVLETTRDIPERPKTQFTLNIPQFAGIYHERPLSEDEALSASVRQSFLQFIIPKLSEENLIIPSFYDSHLRYLKNTDNGYLRVMSISSKDALKLEIAGIDGADETGESRFNISTYFGAFGVEKSTGLGNGWRYTTSPQVNYTNVNNDFLDNYVKVRVWDFTLPLEFEKRISRKEKWYLGLEGSVAKAKVSVLAPRIEEDDPFADFEDAPVVSTEVSDTGRGAAAWTSVDYQAGDVIFTPGVRFYYQSNIKPVGTDPRGQITWDLAEDTKVKVAAGQYSKAPEPYEKDSEFGNEDLYWEKSAHYILGLEHKWNQDWLTEFQVYQKKNKDMVRSHPVDRFRNSGQLRSMGFEIFARKFLTSRWFGWISYTWSETEEKADSDAAWLPSQFDQTHVLNLVTAYKFSGQWNAGGRFNYHSGDRYTPVSGAVYNSGLSKYQPRYDPDKVNDARLPGWHQLDLYTTYDQLTDYYKIKYKFGIEFLAAERPAFGVTYNYDYSEKDYFRGVPPIPYVEVSGEF